MTLALSLGLLATGMFLGALLIILIGTWLGTRADAADDRGYESPYLNDPPVPRRMPADPEMLGAVYCPPPRTTGNASPWYRAGGLPSDSSLANHEKGK